MNKAFEQIIEFENTTPAELFDIFLDAKRHSAIHGGARTKISKKEGKPFSCLDGHVTGRNLAIIPDKMIVQSWRGDVWDEDDQDSILILSFSSIPGGAQIHLVHSHTPDQFTERWDEVYWNPIKDYLINK
jgi:activator of HSP90 ATPase